MKSTLRWLAASAATLVSISALPAQESPPAPVTLASGNAGKNYLNLSLDGLVAAGTSTEPAIEDIAGARRGLGWFA